MVRTKNPARRKYDWGVDKTLNNSTPPQRQMASRHFPQETEEDLKMEEEVVEEEEKNALVTRQSKLESTLPPSVRFPLVVLTSLALSSCFYSVSSQWTAGELASVSKKDGGWQILAGLLGWRGAEIALGWFGDYDSYDLVSLMMLSHYPTMYLLSAFYNVSTSTAITSLIIDGLATYIPFRMFRQVSPAHRASSEDGIPSQDIITDPYIQTLNIILAASIYSTTLYASYMTFLPASLATYFNDIPTVLPAHTSTPISLLPVNLLLGLAANSFVFTPAAALPRGRVSGFDPAAATFQETLWYNLWGFSERTKMIIKRTAALVGVVGFNGLLQLWGTIEGVEFTGAAIYSSVWAVASLITGVVFNLVCDV